MHFMCVFVRMWSDFAVADFPIGLGMCLLKVAREANKTKQKQNKRSRRMMAQKQVTREFNCNLVK